MKNAKKVILFLGAILLVAFGSFNTIGSKSNKNAVAETKEETTSKKESKKADAVAVALEMVVVHGVETHQGGEQANISLGDAITHEVTVIGQALLKGV